jgi:hypothetical protein
VDGFDGRAGDDRGRLIHHLPGDGSAIRLCVRGARSSEKESDRKDSGCRTRMEHDLSFAVPALAGWPRELQCGRLNARILVPQRIGCQAPLATIS